MPVIQDTQQVEIGLWFKATQGKVTETPSQKTCQELQVLSKVYMRITVQDWSVQKLETLSEKYIIN
jgi:hypothetical protein